MALFLNTTEIESALVNFETSYPALCQRIALPEQTHEGRQCHALRIAKDYDPQRPAVLILGGVHAREWGGPDIVVNFVGDVLRAYANGKGLQYGRKIFSANEIKTILETTTVLVFPCVNPDGVHFSHTGATREWRKNRNPAHFNGDPKSIGVDINRNYDFLWDYKTCFHQRAWSNSLASDNPLIETFHGDRPFSEPETRNVKWLMDNIPKLTLFLDLHSFAGDVLYSWGNDQNQSVDPAMNFRNPAYDGKRGDADDPYKEYVPPADAELTATFAERMRTAVFDATGADYKVGQSFSLYAVSGAPDDYAYSRQWIAPGKPRILSFVIELGSQFHPVPSEVQKMGQELAAALIELGMVAASA